MVKKNAELLISNKNPKIYDIVSIKVQGLESHEEVRIEAKLIQEGNDRIWKSEALFIADVDGIVDLSKQAPILGSYSGVDPMGLFWSMNIDPEEKIRDAFIHDTIDPMIVYIRVQAKNGKILEEKISRQIADPGIRKIPIREGDIRGILWLPPGKGPFPGVIVLGGAGRNEPSESHAALFTNYGFAVLSLAYFFSEGLPSRLKNIPVEYFHKGILWMKQNPSVLSERLAVVGTSLGGSAALLAASYFPEIKSVVSIMGRGIITQSIDLEEEDEKACSTFMVDGTPLPFLPFELPKWTEENYQSPCIARMILKSLGNIDDAFLEKISIKVENIHGPVLLIAGTDDLTVVTPLLSDIAYMRLTKSNFSHDKEFIIYKGTGHLIGEKALPYAPTTIASFYFTPKKLLYSLGGNPKDRSDAVVESWSKIISFLQKNTQANGL